MSLERQQRETEEANSWFPLEDVLHECSWVHELTVQIGQQSFKDTCRCSYHHFLNAANWEKEAGTMPPNPLMHAASCTQADTADPLFSSFRLVDVWLRDWQSRCAERENAIEAFVWNSFHGGLGCTFPPLFLEATANFTHPYLAPFRWQGACFCMGRRHWAICHTQKRSERERCSLGSLPAWWMWGGSPPVSMVAPSFIRIPLQMRHNSLSPLPPLCVCHLSPRLTPLTVFQRLRNLSKVRDGMVSW